MTPPYAGAAARDADPGANPDGTHRVLFSFELFPPRTEKVAAKMPAIIDELASLEPEFISVTYGAGGSSRETSLGLLKHIRTRSKALPMAHLTCVGSTYNEAASIVREFLDNGITDFLALRGDPPAGLTEHDDFLGDLRTGAELVQLIHRVRAEHESYLTGTPEGASSRWRIGGRRRAHVCVATYPNGHPQSRDIQQDYDTLLAKEAAGANLAFTQLFFHADDYLRFVDGARAAGVTMPILPGLLAVTSTQRLRRMAELAGEEIPVGLFRSLERAKSPAARREIGIAHATAQALDLLEGGAPGIHLYTQNRIDEPTELLARIGAIPRRQERDASSAPAPGAAAATADARMRPPQLAAV